MKRLSWSKLFSLAALLSLGVVTSVANASTQTPSPRIPGTYSGSNPQVPAGTRAEFEGIAATDYFNSSAISGLQGSSNALANPQIATGPSDLLMIVNSQIVRVPNANSPGNKSAGIYPANTATGGVTPNAFQKAFLDNWIGEPALSNLCPTGGTADTGDIRNSVTCQFENSNVVYDQLQGRFVVLFTVVDTGLTLQPNNTYALTRPRKASWVLLISRFAVLADQACIQGTTCPAGVTPGVPNAAGLNVFITPTPPQGVTGGLNTKLWTIYYGDSVADLGATDGFGSDPASASAGVGAGNINSPIPGSGSAASFSCGADAVYAAGVAIPANAKECLLPVSARLGYDNDNLIIVSTVVNANIPNSALSSTLSTANFTYPAYAGNRVRVIKKAAVYINKTPLVVGNQFLAGGLTARAAGDYYDLYTQSANVGAQNNPDALGTPVNTGAGMPPIKYTVVMSPAACVTDAGFPGVFFSNTACDPVIYEPVRLRGRAMATFSNLPLGTMSQTYLVGARYLGSLITPAAPAPGPNGVPVQDSGLFVQGIVEVYPAAVSVSLNNLFANAPFYPVLQDNNTAPGAEPNGIGTPSAFAIPYPFTQPAPVPQLGSGGTGLGPNLWVGDARVQKVIFREGHLYDARAAGASNFNLLNTFSQASLSSTVFYDVVQKLSNTQFPSLIYTATPGNWISYAPAFDIPANVKTYGLVFGTDQTSILDRVPDFVATTYPPLAGTPDNPIDPLTGNPVGYDPRAALTFGNSGTPAQPMTNGNCYNYQLTPGVPAATTNDAHAWASLLDSRCGQDVTGSTIAVRDPQSGLFVTHIAYTTRGDAGIDPNDGSIWNYGAYAQQRDVTTGSTAHWGTFASNYKMYMPTVDQLGNSTIQYNDIAGIPEAPYIMIAANVGLAPNKTASVPNITPLPFAGGNPTLYPPVAGVTTPGAAPAAGSFGPNDPVTRREMAAWIVKSQMDEAAITAYLAATGGNFATFADVPVGDPGYRYVEVMARRGYTAGCSAGAARRYCPDYMSTRKDLAVFMIRAKLSNVFPSVLSGCGTQFVSGTTTPAASTLYPPATTTNCAGGDNFAFFAPGLPYFTDNVAQTGNDEWAYIQMMRELGITVGISLGPNNDGRNGAYGRGPAGFPSLTSANDIGAGSGILLRKQVAVFMVRGFFF